MFVRVRACVCACYDGWTVGGSHGWGNVCAYKRVGENIAQQVRMDSVGFGDGGGGWPWGQLLQYDNSSTDFRELADRLFIYSWLSNIMFLKITNSSERLSDRTPLPSFRR